MGDLIFYPETHTYWLDGKQLPSVTDVLRFLSQDAYSKISKYTLQTAAERGTRIHEACEVFDLYGELPDYEEDYDIFPYVTAYANFCNDYQPVWMAIEEPVTDGEYAGTVDRIGRVKGIDGLVCVDVKSSSKIYINSVSAQVYKYSNMYSQQSPVPVGEETSMYCLHLKNTGQYDFIKLDWLRGFQAWNACADLDKLIRSEGN